MKTSNSSETYGLSACDLLVAGVLARKGMTLVPLSLCLNNRGLIKVELGLCRGRQSPDKRDRLRKETDKRETARAIALHERR